MQLVGIIKKKLKNMKVRSIAVRVLVVNLVSRLIESIKYELGLPVLFYYNLIIIVMIFVS